MPLILSVKIDEVNPLFNFSVVKGRIRFNRRISDEVGVASSVSFRNILCDDVFSDSQGI